MYTMMMNLLEGQALRVFEHKFWVSGDLMNIIYKLVIKGLKTNKGTTISEEVPLPGLV